jgi:hypothetical protein
MANQRFLTAWAASTDQGIQFTTDHFLDILLSNFIQQGSPYSAGQSVVEEI